MKPSEFNALVYNTLSSARGGLPKSGEGAFYNHPVIETGLLPREHLRAAVYSSLTGDPHYTWGVEKRVVFPRRPKDVDDLIHLQPVVLFIAYLQREPIGLRPDLRIESTDFELVTGQENYEHDNPNFVAKPLTIVVPQIIGILPIVDTEVY